MKRLLKLRHLIWLALPLLLWYALRQVPFADIRLTLSALSPTRILVLIVVNIAITLLFSARLWLILRAQGQRLPYFSLAAYRLAGFAVSYFTPGAQFGGEPLQVYLLEKQHGISTSTALAAITLDKLFEILANFTFLLIGITLIINGGPLAGLASGNALIGVVGLLSLPLVYLFVLWSGRLPFTGLLAWLPASLRERPLVKKLAPFLASGEAQIAALLRQRPVTILWALFVSGVVWLLSIGEYWLLLSFLGSRLTLFQTITALTAARLAFLTPLPGGLGALEAGQALAMQALGFSPALGLSVALLIRGRDVSMGLLGLWLGAFFTRRNSQPAPKGYPLPHPAGDEFSHV